MVELSEKNIRGQEIQSSKGNQLKWQRDGIWYKADYTGYEGLAEYMVSSLLKASNLESSEYISYQTEGDTVEADDVNRLQDEIYRTQSAVNTAERRVEEIKTGLEEDMQELEESFQAITEPEIDELDNIEGFEPGEGGGGCDCSALTEEEIDAVTPGGGIPQFAYDPLTAEEIEEATQ